MRELKEMLAHKRSLFRLVKSNRSSIRKKIEENQKIRTEYEAVEKEIYDLVSERMEKGETLYEICMKEFGKIDENFHAIYAIFH